MPRQVPNFGSFQTILPIEAVKNFFTRPNKTTRNQIALFERLCYQAARNQHHSGWNLVDFTLYAREIRFVRGHQPRDLRANPLKLHQSFRFLSGYPFMWNLFINTPSAVLLLISFRGIGDAMKKIETLQNMERQENIVEWVCEPCCWIGSLGVGPRGFT